MKKNLTAALTTALVVGAASTTFAAANPFSDVPMDHWAYDAVAQLADDGIVEGYGDGTYRGETEITRYEMAQMVAKAMAKEEQADAQQRAMIHRLAAEFSEELNNLGVRIENLESRIGNVKWSGRIEYKHERMSEDGADTKTVNNLLFRLEPMAVVNDHWKVKARLDANWDTKRDRGPDVGSSSNVKLKRAYVIGNYGVTEIKAGLMPFTSEQTVVFDSTFTGASLTLGKDQTFSGTLLAGRKAVDSSETVNLAGGSLNWMPSEKFAAAAEYYRLSSDGDSNIWGVGATYAFSENAALSAGYWKNTSVDEKTKNRAANIELNYKGADQMDAHSFGLYAAYRYLGEYTAVLHGFDGADAGQRGWEVGGDYTFSKNIVGTLKYFNGKKIENTDIGVSKFYGTLDYFF